MVTERLRQHPDLTVRPGVVSLSPTEQSGLKSYSYQTISAIQQSDGTKITFGKTALGLNDPGKYRNQLLGLVAKSVTETKKSLGIAGAVEIGGLENLVAVMQINESEVVLFINYKFRIEAKAT